MGIKDRNVDKVGGLSPRNIRWKTDERVAGSYQLTVEDAGCRFSPINSGGLVTYILPEITPAIAGIWYTFYNATTARTIVVQATPSDSMIAVGDVGADQVRYTTASQIAAGAFTLICDGVSWLCLPHHWDCANLAQTITVNT